MEYVYGALVLHAAGKPVNEENLKKVLTAAGVKVDETRVKALTAALEGVNIDEALKAAVAMPTAAPAAAPPPRRKKRRRKRKRRKKRKSPRKRRPRAWVRSSARPRARPHPFPFLRARAGALVPQAAPRFAASWGRLLRSFAVKPVAFSRNVLYALIVSVAMWSATPVFIDVSTKSFFPSVHAAIFSRAPYDTITFEPSVPTSPNTSAAIFLRPSPSRILPVPLFSSYSSIRIGIPEPRSSHQRYASSTASGSDDVSMNGWVSQ